MILSLSGQSLCVKLRRVIKNIHEKSSIYGLEAFYAQQFRGWILINRAASAVAPKLATSSDAEDIILRFYLILRELQFRMQGV